MERKPLENRGERNEYTPLSTEYNYVHSRMLEEFPEGPYGATNDNQLGKTTGWDTGEEANPRFSYENEQLHEAAGRLDELRDPVRTNPKGKVE